MEKEYRENKRLSRTEVISELNNLLNVVKNDYPFLWEGNPSLINKYGGCPTHFGTMSEFSTNGDFNMFVPFSTSLPNLSEGGFDALGIVKHEGGFKFYLQVADIPDCEFYEKGTELYDALIKQVDLNESRYVQGFAQEVYKNLEKILKRDFEDKLANLKEKLKI